MSKRTLPDERWGGIQCTTTWRTLKRYSKGDTKHNAQRCDRMYFGLRTTSYVASFCFLSLGNKGDRSVFVYILSGMQNKECFSTTDKSKLEPLARKLEIEYTIFRQKNKHGISIDYNFKNVPHKTKFGHSVASRFCCNLTSSKPL